MLACKIMKRASEGLLSSWFLKSLHLLESFTPPDA